VSESEAACALNGATQVKRVCIQVVNTKDWRSKVGEFLSHLDIKSVPPICLSCQPKDVDEIAEWFACGVERVGIPLDAATQEVHRAVKSGSWEKTMGLLLSAAARFPGRIGTHLIVGLGETEREMATVMELLYKQGVSVALFAFTPVKGTPLQNAAPPPLDSYRRLQAARYVLAAGLAKSPFQFDEAGRLIEIGLPYHELREELADGEAFRTSGCPDCNRPYYNERPGGTMYNYPRPLTRDEAEEAIRAMDLLPVWRVIDSGNNTGAWNMAIDEAIMNAVAEGTAPPTVRVYGWNPPALSLAVHGTDTSVNCQAAAGGEQLNVGAVLST
jgi:biotin synthase